MVQASSEAGVPVESISEPSELRQPHNFCGGSLLSYQIRAYFGLYRQLLNRACGLPLRGVRIAKHAA